MRTLTIRNMVLRTARITNGDPDTEADMLIRAVNNSIGGLEGNPLVEFGEVVPEAFMDLLEAAERLQRSGAGELEAAEIRRLAARARASLDDASAALEGEED